MSKKLISLFPGNVKSYFQNKIFDQKTRDEWNPIFIYLKKLLNQKNIEINTIDIPTKTLPDWYIYIDIPYFWEPAYLPYWKELFSHTRKNILFSNETPMVIPYNHMKIFHFFFDKVFTWDDDLVDNRKYFKVNLPKNNPQMSKSIKRFKDKKFLILINSNKSALLPFKIISPLGKELYSERIKAIDFFEKKIPDRFFLYGRGWNKAKKYNLKEAIFGYKKYSTYKGEVETNGKINLLSNFKYCICFENITNVKSYITEKLFDCFKAGCVPIYWGASNITNYIPKDCFIDFREFRNYDNLLKYLDSIDENKYNSFTNNIRSLMSNKNFIETWFEEGFGKLVLKDVLEV